MAAWILPPGNTVVKTVVLFGMPPDGVKTRIPIVQTVGRQADYLRGLRVGNRDRERGRIGDVAGRIAGTSQQRVAGVRRRGRVPTHAVGSGGVLGAEQGAIQLELHAGNADVVRGVGGDGHGAGHDAPVRSRHARRWARWCPCWKP